MNVLINSECSIVPEGAKLLTSEGNILLNFLFALGYNPSDPPYGDLLKTYYKLEGEWVILSLVHWEATHNDAMIVSLNNELQLQEPGAKSWFHLFSEYLAEEGNVLHYHDNETWLLSNNQQHPLNAKPVHHLLNRSLMPEIMQLSKTMYWQKFLTESQMLFASKPNRSLINGLWVWGNAKLKKLKPISICADEQFFSLAQICSPKVTLYNPLLKLKNYQIILLTEFSILSNEHQEELKKLPLDWFWNNVAYRINSGSWYSCLWRKLIHAN